MKSKQKSPSAQVKSLIQAFEPQYNAILAAVKPIARDGSEEFAELAVLVDNAAYHLFQRLTDLHDAMANDQSTPAPRGANGAA